MQVFHILLRILSGIAGALLLYMAFFLYEDEEARLQNRLEQVWRRINALQSSAISKEVAFLQGVTRAASAILDRLLGHQLVSPQSITVSMAFSLASLFVWFSYILIAIPFTYSRVPSLLTFVYAVILFALGSLPAWVTRDKASIRTHRQVVQSHFYRLGLVLLVICSPWLMIKTETFFDHNLGFDPSTIMVIELSVILGVLVDIFFITFFRWMLKNIANLSALLPIILCFVAVTAVTVVLIGPAFLLLTNSDYADMSTLNIRQRLIAQLGYGCMTNLIDAICLLLLLVIMMLLLAHRLIWPLIKRPLYAANRKQLFKNTKLLGALGTILILYAFPNSPLVKWVTHFLPNLKEG
jgi:hypothetical protein